MSGKFIFFILFGLISLQLNGDDFYIEHSGTGKRGLGYDLTGVNKSLSIETGSGGVTQLIVGSSNTRNVSTGEKVSEATTSTYNKTIADWTPQVSTETYQCGATDTAQMDVTFSAGANYDAQAPGTTLICAVPSGTTPTNSNCTWYSSGSVDFHTCTATGNTSYSFYLGKQVGSDLGSVETPAFATKTVACDCGGTCQCQSVT
jgi:hypothetical protein